jgi:hypothetical protein
MSFAFTCAVAWSIGAAAASPTGSVYGKISTKPAYFLGQKANGYQRRLALAAPAQREPSGVVVTIEGAALDKEKFPPATDEVPVRIGDGGFGSQLIGAMMGTTIVFDNTLDRPLALAGAPQLKAPIAPGTPTPIQFEEPGVYTITEPSLPGSKLTLVITKNPYVIALDDTGEFLFDALDAGSYTLKIFTREQAVSRPLDIKAGEEAKFALPLGRPVAAASPAPVIDQKKDVKPQPAPGQP